MDPETWLDQLRETLGAASSCAEMAALHAATPAAASSDVIESSIRPIADSLVSIAEALDLRPRVPFATGAVCSPRIEPLLLAVPGGGAAAVIPWGLAGFVHLLMKIVAAAVPMSGDGDNVQFDLKAPAVQARLAANSEVGDRFVDLFRAAARGNPHAATPWAQAGPEWQLAAVFRHAAEAFALAGMCASVMIEPKAPPATDSVELGRELSAERILFSTDHLLSADVIAIRLTLEECRRQGWDAGLGYCGVEVFLTGLGLLESLRGAADPPSRYRRSFLRTVLKAPNTEGMLSMGSLASGIVETLWERNEGSLR